jgi:putative Mn2+ efflux pump MntP
MLLVDQELSTLPEHMISSLVLVGFALFILYKYMSSRFNTNDVRFVFTLVSFGVQILAMSVVSHAIGYDGIVITTKTTYLRSSLTQIFRINC